MFQRKFPRCDRGKPNTVFLGGGSGFVSKTVVYPMFGEKEGIEITSDNTEIGRASCRERV